jgi:hypothetical protein
MAGSDQSLDDLIAGTRRGLLVTFFWYIRGVPATDQPLLNTGMTRDGLCLIENGEITGAVQNFRWNMSPVVGYNNLAAVGRPDELKGQSLVVFVTLKNDFAPSEEMKEKLRAHVAKEIGAIARPDTVRFAAGLPKTRSGKIMRRILKQIAEGKDIKGDTSTLEDFTVIATLQSED